MTENQTANDPKAGGVGSMELLACPFCGAPAEIEETETLGDVRKSVGCNTEHCQGYQSHATFATRREAIGAWNQRIDPAKTSLVKALEAVLLFHAGLPWDATKRQKWDAICGELLPKAFNDYGLYDRTHGFDATTKMLCDVARAALKHANGEVRRGGS